MGSFTREASDSPDRSAGKQNGSPAAGDWKVQLKRQIRGLSYSDQVQCLSPVQKQEGGACDSDEPGMTGPGKCSVAEGKDGAKEKEAAPRWPKKANELIVKHTLFVSLPKIGTQRVELEGKLVGKSKRPTEVVKAEEALGDFKAAIELGFLANQYSLETRTKDFAKDFAVGFVKGSGEVDLKALGLEGVVISPSFELPNKFAVALKGDISKYLSLTSFIIEAELSFTWAPSYKLLKETTEWAKKLGEAVKQRRKHQKEFKDLFKKLSDDFEAEVKKKAKNKPKNKLTGKERRRLAKDHARNARAKIAAKQKELENAAKRIKAAKEAGEKAANGLKKEAGEQAAKRLGGKTVGRVLSKIVPVLNVVSNLYDAGELLMKFVDATSVDPDWYFCTLFLDQRLSYADPSKAPPIPECCSPELLQAYGIPLFSGDP